MPIKITLAKAVRFHRAANALTIDAAAKATGIRKGTWIDIEQGRANPRLSTLSAIAHILQIPINALFTSYWPDNSRTDETLQDDH